MVSNHTGNFRQHLSHLGRHDIFFVMLYVIPYRMDDPLLVANVVACTNEKSGYIDVTEVDAVYRC